MSTEHMRMLVMELPLLRDSTLSTGLRGQTLALHANVDAHTFAMLFSKMARMAWYASRAKPCGAAAISLQWVHSGMQCTWPNLWLQHTAMQHRKAGQ